MTGAGDCSRLGEQDGHGRYGVLDEDADGLLCHECGRRFAHLGLHAWRRHGITAAEYREEHGLPRRRGLVAAEIHEKVRKNAVDGFERRQRFIEARDPVAAAAAWVASGSTTSAAGKAASRSRPGHGRLGTVVTCEQCGAEFCPLAGARRRRFCSKSCASKATRARSR